MKTIVKHVLVILLVIAGTSCYAQLNTSIKTKTKVDFGSKGVNLNPIIAKRINKSVLENKTLSSIKNKSIPKVNVPKEYINHKGTKSWVITPKKPFSYALGISSFGTFSELGFGISPIDRRLYSGFLFFKAKKNAEYILKIISENAHSVGGNSIVVDLGGPEIEVAPDRHGIYRVAFQSENESELIIAFSAKGVRGGEPTKFRVKQIQIDQL